MKYLICNACCTQFTSVPQSCLNLWDPMHCRTSGFAVLHLLPELAQTHVHWVGDAIQKSHPLSPLLLLPSIFPTIRVLTSETVLHIRWPRYWSFSFSISPSNKYSGLISFRIDYLRVSSHTTVWKRQFFGAQVSL